MRKVKRQLRVLLITRYFTPSDAVGAVRPVKLVHALQSRGHHVTVVTAATGDSQLKDPSWVLRVTPGRSLREVLVRAKGLLTRRNAMGDASAPGSASTNNRASASGRLRTLALSFAWLPDDQQGFILPATLRAVEAASQDSFDLILTTAPPFSTHLSGLATRLLTGLPWAVEFRDPWIMGDDATAVLSPIASSMNRSLERWCLQRSDHVIAVTARTAAVLSAKRRALGRADAWCFLNGIDSFQSTTPGPRAPGPVRVIHAGNLYGGRDPRPFLLSIARLRQESALPTEGVILDFVGEFDTVGGVHLRDLVRELDLEGVVRLHGRTSHEVSLRLQSEADVLLLLAQRQPIQVPNKLYEYLGARKPILAFVDSDGESSDMLRQAEGHFAVSESSEDTDALVLRALKSPLSGWLPSNPARLMEWTTQVQFQRYVDALEASFGCVAPNLRR